MVQTNYSRPLVFIRGHYGLQQKSLNFQSHGANKLFVNRCFETNFPC